MQNNRKTLGILIILLGLALILLIVYFGFLKKETTPSAETLPAATTAQLPSAVPATTTPSDKPLNRQEYDISQEKAHKFNAADLEKLAMSFAERFGSFSNQSAYGNFIDLKIFMTDDLATWVDTYVATLKSQAKNDGSYYGITTRALTAEAKSFDENSGTAQVIVATERRESTGEINGGTSYFQTIDLRFVLEDDEWLADEVYWEK
ncbi:TPA: hypothetical protein DCZ15_02125 [Candidatus Falkowbacteria bacterium]|nr:MAG: hypothetical protein UV95_C0001G0180 [Candidatus Falkowbacteria bacterium GW2011_GWF2_43_32]HBA36652.1 hypothetical protein [Candidatus Falkowbacteria bacterium]